MIGVSISLLFGKLLDRIAFYKLLVPSFLLIAAGYMSIPLLPYPSFLTSCVLIASSAMVIGSTVIVTVMIIKAI